MAAPPETNSLSSLARSKLHLSVSSKDKDRCSLHRWVLLKNSIIRSSPVVPPNTPTSEHAETRHTSLPEESDFPDEDVTPDDEDSFMFPDVGKFGPTVDVNTSEAQWLDSLLETLGDDDEDDFVDGTVIPVEDEEDHLLSPLASPMSSSDDLQALFSSPTPIPPQYSSPFPYRDQLLLAYSPFDSFDSSFQSSLASIPPPYDDPLPYYDQDDVENLSVPDAIEDTSDDESETPPTPLMGRSSSSISSSDAASIPLPAERTRRRHAQPHVYIDSEDSYFYSFELDPLPFPRNHHSSYNTYREC